MIAPQISPEVQFDETDAARWFAENGWTPFDFQTAAWRARLADEEGLILAPTGAGKTYAAWLGALILDQMLHGRPRRFDGAKARRGRRAQTAPLRVIWITPLRALAQDTAEALARPIEALNLAWSIETRTSDSSTYLRAQQSKRLPSALITTPESLSVLLTRPNVDEMFKELHTVIVDEWHELLGTKRGVQTELALARLRAMRPSVRTWGMSATVGNLDEALTVLTGVGRASQPVARIIKAGRPKRVVIDSLLPKTIDRFPWVGHIGLALLPEVVAVVEAHRSTLIFTNTRAQSERWYQALLEARPDWAGDIALHHGSLDLKKRAWVEDRLRRGALRAVVCTSTLDLGVDFPAVERVLQVGSPKSIARLLQRAGRSGHRPDLASRVTCVPTHALELLEVSAVRSGATNGAIESRTPILLPLDVLVQHVVTVAIGGGFDADQLLREIRTTFAFARLSDATWEQVLAFVMHGGTLKAYERYHRVKLLDGRYTVADPEVARTHRMSIGTILGESSLRVKYVRGGDIGQIEEDFASRLKPGDRFTLDGKTLAFVRLRESVVQVRRAAVGIGAIPRWQGSLLPLSSNLTQGIRDKLSAAGDGRLDDPELRALAPLLNLQARWSALPHAGVFVTEHLQTRDGYHLFAYPLEGRLVNEGLATLIAHRAIQRKKTTITISANDYGFELLSSDPIGDISELLRQPTDIAALTRELAACLNVSEMTRRQFREIARISGLVMPRFAGGRMTSKQLQTSSGLIFDVLDKYDEANLLLEQARREVLARQLEIDRLMATLRRLAAIPVSSHVPPGITPFGFPLMVDRMRSSVSSETLEDRVRRIMQRQERQASL